VRARPRFNKDEVDDEDDVVDDDAIRCKVLGETDDDDFRNKTRAMADIYIFLNFLWCNKFCRRRLCSFELRKREKRGKMHQTLLLYSSLLLLQKSFVRLLLYLTIIIDRLIEYKVLRINSAVAVVVIASQSSTVCG
jgi:hypothetical protein